MLAFMHQYRVEARPRPFAGAFGQKDSWAEESDGYGNHARRAGQTAGADRAYDEPEEQDACAQEINGCQKLRPSPHTRLWFGGSGVAGRSETCPTGLRSIDRQRWGRSLPCLTRQDWKRGFRSP